ncbi:hypothetical protein [Wenzhouxiangella limi]|uniref:Dicarboxylate transport domain-containing protein n=1 Tax=Wenzhouxiangella limi TaxID=2707351 RepID=A0A845UZI9_9GAMM|nr:hypothetical protein [Wenzhouxiangella limi]NDY94476.1 hypothetical protein [Wenzhouxiangella limi]
MLDLQSGPGRLGPLSWEALELRRLPGQERSPGLQVELTGLGLGDGLPSGDLALTCRRWAWARGGAGCSGGQLAVPEEWLALDGELDLTIALGPAGGYRIRLEHPQLLAELDWSQEAGAVLRLDRLDLDVIAPMIDPLLALSALGGAATGTVRVDEDGIRGELAVDGAFFDTPDGLAAGDGIELELEVASAASEAEFRVSLRQTAGELLLGPVYLPPPEQPLALEADLGLAEPGKIQVSRLRLSDPGGLTLSGSATLADSDSGWQPERLSVDALDVDLATLWPRWLDGPAAAVGFPDLAARGRIQGTLDWARAGAGRIDLRAEGVSLRDSRGRAGVQGLSGELSGTDEALRIAFGWEALALLGLDLGGAQARLHYDEVGLRLLEPVRVALFDGALVIDGLALLVAPDLESQLVLDARIEPVDLARLTRALDLPELGGRLAGRFPGVTYRDQRLAFTGGIEIDAFSGRIGVEQLVIERLLGSAPALSAQIELERLNLLELTGAFGFGRMEGQVSGWAHDLRLLNWRPAAMDARLYTHEDVPRRRISQRAVDNLSSLGGGGSAVISGTILRLFEDFPYRRAGLACRLANNICHIDGVAPHESGGFLIVEGRGLPHLDIVGHRRLVDWPQLMDQLAGMIERGSAQPGEGQGGSSP